VQYRGVNYDVGIHPLRNEPPSRPRFDPVIVRRELEIIRRDLNCNAIRIVGRDLQRLVFAAEHALELGLTVWFSPALHDATPRESLAHLAECAEAAEQLRRLREKIVFVTGWELTFFMHGLVMGATGPERMRVFMSPWKLLANTLLKGPFNWRLDRFLTRANTVVREHFKGPVTYAAGMWESVDWRRFDFVAVDCYRDAGNETTFGGAFRKYLTAGKPVVATEFGCCTYRGAADKGAYGWAIVDWNERPPRLRGRYVRDESEQAECLVRLLDVFEAERAAGAFVFTFVAPKYLHHPDPALDLDVASYALVKSGGDAPGPRYPDMPWEPKLAFDAVARRFAR
jgi:hypothetical protein